jgi:methyl-accepting chemotaxis protein
MSNLQSVLNMSPRRDISITAASASGLVKTSTQQSRKFSDDRTHPPKPDNKDDGNADEQSFAAKCVDVAFQISMFLLPFQLWGLAYLRREGPKFRNELKLQIVDAHNFEAELQNQIRFMKERAESDGEHSHYLELKRDELGNILEDEFEMSALTYAERIAELEESLETVKASRKTLEEIDNSFSVRIFSEPIPFIGDLGTI